MNDGEKVIKGLGEVRNYIDIQKRTFESDLGLRNDRFENALRSIDDAMALLKAQEPRVMTPEELIGSIILNRDRMVWFEFRDSVVPMNTKSLVYNDYIVDDDMPMLGDPNIVWRDGDGKKDGVIVAEYNDVFRCWTSRPTDAQKEEAKWE